MCEPEVGRRAEIGGIRVVWPQTKVSRRGAEPGLASPRFANAASVRGPEPWVCVRLRRAVCVTSAITSVVHMASLRRWCDCTDVPSTGCL